MVVWFNLLDYSARAFSELGDSKSLLSFCEERHLALACGIENYLIRAAGLYDRCLNLVNATLCLGLSSKACRHSRVSNHALIKGTEAGVRLSAINKELNYVRSVRDGVVHHKTYDDHGVLTWLKIAMESAGGPWARPAEEIETASSHCVSVYGNLMAKLNKKLYKLVGEFYGELRLEFDNRLGEW